MRKYHYMISLWLAFGLSMTSALQAPAGSPAPLTPVWTVTEGMDAPESAYFDAASGFIFVSQIGGQAAARDGNGRISKLTTDGKLVAADWVAGLNAPKGLRARQGTLYTADLDDIVAIDIASGRIVSRVHVDIGGEIQQMFDRLRRHPEAGQIGMSVSGAPRRGLEIDLAVWRPRHVLPGIWLPLGRGRGGQQQRDGTGRQKKAHGAKS